MGTATLKRSAATESRLLCRLMAGNDDPTVNMANAAAGARMCEKLRGESPRNPLSVISCTILGLSSLGRTEPQGLAGIEALF